jgi:glutamate racemase
MENQAPIGIFDSGVGGLSVLREIRKQLPRERLIFLADQAHVPYGPRPLEQVRDFAEGITRYLLSQDAKLVVVACNAASAAALHHLRQIFPQVPFVGMEPAVKPAVEHTHSGIVGVLATPATFQGALYASVLERFAQGVIVLQDTCPGLVAQIEAGQLDTPATRQILERALQPMLAQGIDTVVLGCTHYPFVIPLIQEIVGKAVRVIDPAPAVARQVARVLVTDTITTRDQIPGPARYLTTSESSHLQVLLEELIGETTQVEKLVWRDNQLELNQI